MGPKVLGLTEHGIDIALCCPGHCVRVSAEGPTPCKHVGPCSSEIGRSRTLKHKARGRPRRGAARGGSEMRIGKTIGGKLYWGFGGILIVVIALSLADLAALIHEQTTKDTYKRAIEMAWQTSRLEQAVLNSGLHLRNYLLGNGDTHEADLLNQNMHEVDQDITDAEVTASFLSQGDGAKQLLEQVRAIQKDWGETFASPLVEKRRQLDQGNVTMSELSIAYLQAKSEQERKTKVDEPLGKLSAIMTASLFDADNSDRTASNWIRAVTILGMLLMSAGVVVISWRVAKSITTPLGQL